MSDEKTPEEKMAQYRRWVRQRYKPELHPFVDALFEGLPEDYLLTDKGIVLRARGSKSKPIASTFRVKAATKSDQDMNQSFLVEVLDRDQVLVECVVPNRFVQTKSWKAIELLADAGMRLGTRYDKDVVLDAIDTWRDLPTLKQNKSIGWTPDRAAFILPSGKVLSRPGAKEVYSYAGQRRGVEKGDLATWRDGIAAPCSGNVNLLFALSAAFAAMLLPFIADAETVIYHFAGKTTGGKTTMLNAALTVAQQVSKKPRSWNSTGNGLMAAIARSNHILFGLDELKEESKSDLAQVIYDVANGVDRTRATKEGESAELKEWLTLVLSTGEITTADALAAAKQKKRGGQGVRMIDIPVDDYGILDNLHDQPTTDAFIAQLRRNNEGNAGTAGAAFVQKLMQLGDFGADLEADIRAQTVKLYQTLGVVEGDQATAEVRRVLKGLAIVAVAGEWATKFGITGWTSGEAAAAVHAIALRAKLPFAESDTSEQTEAVNAMRDALMAGRDRFLDISHEAEPAGVPEGLLGYRDAQYFHVLPKALEAMHTGRKADVVASLLKAAKLLEPGGETMSHQCRISLPKWLGKERPRVYRVRRSILEA